jgi:hypothetical protein
MIIYIHVYFFALLLGLKSYFIQYLKIRGVTLAPYKSPTSL